MQKRGWSFKAGVLLIVSGALLIQPSDSVALVEPASLTDSSLLRHQSRNV